MPPPGSQSGACMHRGSSGTWASHLSLCPIPGKGDRATNSPGVVGGLRPAHEPVRDTTNAPQQARYRGASDQRSAPRGAVWQSERGISGFSQRFLYSEVAGERSLEVSYGIKKHLKNKGSCVSWKVTKPQHIQEPTHVAIHMRTTHRIRLSLSLQAPFSLCASPALCDLLLARGCHHLRSRRGHAQRGLALCASRSLVLGLLRMVCSGQWDAHAVLSGMSKKVLRGLPPPADRRLYLIGDTTHKTKRGRQHPLGHVTRQSESSRTPLALTWSC